MYCLTTDYKVLALGEGNTLGRGLGQTSATNSAVYVKGIGGIGDLASIRDVFAISYGAIAVDFAGRAIAWGHRYVVCMDNTYDYYPKYIPGYNTDVYLYNIIKTVSMDMYTIPNYFTAIVDGGNLVMWGGHDNFGRTTSLYPYLYDTNVVDYVMSYSYTVILKNNGYVYETTAMGSTQAYVGNAVGVCAYGEMTGIFVVLSDSSVIGSASGNMPGFGEEGPSPVYKNVPGPRDEGILTNVTKCSYFLGTAHVLTTDGHAMGTTNYESGLIGDGTKGEKNIFSYLAWNIYRR